MKDKIILKDNTTIEVEAFGELNNMITVCKDWQQVGSVMSMLTEDNISSVQVPESGGEIVGNYKDLILQKGTYEIKEDGIHLGISFREKTSVEKRLDNLEEEVTNTQMGLTEIYEGTEV